MLFQLVYRFKCVFLPALLFLTFPVLQAQAQDSTASAPAQPHKPIHRPTSASTNSNQQIDPIEEHFRAAEKSQLTNDLNTAESEYRKVISLAVQKLAVRRGHSRDESGLPTAYLAALKEMLGNAYHNLGVIYAQNSRYSEASQLFAQAAKRSPHIKDLDRNWGTASFRANEYKTAIAPLQRHVRVYPLDTSALQMLAVCYFMTDNFSRAAAAFRPLLPTLPNEPNLLYAAGVSFAKSGDSQTARNLYQRMLAQNPDSAEVHLFMGQAHAAQREDADALKEFSWAVELNPKLPEAHYSAGKVYLQQGNLEEAEKEFRAELEVNPDDAPTEYRLGHVLLAQSKMDEAVSLLSEVVRQRPEDADALYELGKALLEKGELVAAAERLEKAIHLKPEQPHMYYQLSLVYRREGRIKDADAALHQYQKLQQKKFPNKNSADARSPR